MQKIRECRFENPEGAIQRDSSLHIAGSEIGAFAIAALSGFMGTSALDYFTANLLKKEAHESGNEAG